MGILDTFRNKKNKNEIGQQANEIVSDVENSLDTENESVTKIAKQFSKEIHETIITDSDANTIAELSEEEKQKVINLYISVLKEIKENENISEAVLGKMVLDLIQNASKEIGVAVAKNAVTVLPDDSLKKIIATPEVEPKDAAALIEGINDSNIRENEKEKLNVEKINKIYDNCAQMLDSKLVDEIKKILESMDKKSEEIDKVINETIAKKIAVNFSNYGTSLIKAFNKIIPPLDMLENDLLDLVNVEYKKIEKDSNKNLKPYRKYILKGAIIQELGKEIASQYLSQPINNRRILIPESEKIKEFNIEEEDKLISSIENACKSNSPKQYELQDARNQIHGRSNTEEISELNSRLYAIDNSKVRAKIANYYIDMIDILETFSDKDKERIIQGVANGTKTVVNKMHQKRNDVNLNEKVDNEKE